MTVIITPIPAFTDNYIWCLHDGVAAWVVDPGDAAPVLAFLQQHGLRLEGILITHHHHDHTGGIAELQQQCAPRLTAGPANPAIAGIDRPLRDSDRLDVLGLRLEILAVPGHTLDHIAYVATEHTPPLLFCGDTLFAAGCGRLFEGTPAQMYESLQKFARLPADTRIYCTHEYTEANLRFALAVEPGNAALRQRALDAAALRARQLPTLPSTLALELSTNPFLRTRQAEVRAALPAAEQNGPDVDVFAALRRWKDHF